MNGLINDIITSSPDAKPLVDSLTARWVFITAAGWAAQNIVSWLELDQSTTTTVVAGLIGFVSFLGALVGIMRREGIKVPDWLIEILEAINKEPQKQ